MERICLRDERYCLNPTCRKYCQSTMHIRVKTDKYDVSQAMDVYGWECETCGSVKTDKEGLMPRESARVRGMLG
jgi:hypothetical protein